MKVVTTFTERLDLASMWSKITREFTMNSEIGFYVNKILGKAENLTHFLTFSMKFISEEINPYILIIYKNAINQLNSITWRNIVGENIGSILLFLRQL